MSETVLWIWLSLAVTVGSESFKKLIAKFGTPDEIYQADADAITAVIGSRSKDFHALCDKSLDKARDIYKFCTEKGVGILTYSDRRFPEALREIKNPPVLLYYRGVLPDFSEKPFVAVVGTRHLTEYGRRNAYVISRDLSGAGAVIVSGMAKGVDGVATAGALSQGGITVAFLGSGIDVCYPYEHLTLAREMVKGGCIMTEYPPGTLPLKNNFPRRNRLISGLCSATLVIEGRIRSGAIITAGCAKEQGRPVFALPGNVDLKTSEVTNLLIKNGARLITDASDIISYLEGKYPKIINPYNVTQDSAFVDFDYISKLKVSCVTPSDSIFPNTGGRKGQGRRKEKMISQQELHSEKTPVSTSAAREALSSDKDALSVYERIPEGEDCFAEGLCDETFDMKKIMRILLKLEMRGFIRLLPGGKVKRNK